MTYCRAGSVHRLEKLLLTRSAVTSGRISLSNELFGCCLALLLLCTYSWGACSFYNDEYQGYCWTGGCNPNYPSCVTGGTNGKPYPCRYDGEYWRGEIYGKCAQYGAQQWTFEYITGYCCSSQAEADSAYCALNPTAEGCVEEDVPPSCQADYQQCVGLGGVWRKGASTSTECASECDLCNSAAQIKVLNSWSKVCCAQGKAPPDSAQRCIPPRGGSGGGMEASQFVNNDGNISCGSLTTSDGEIIQENAALYKRFCMDHDEYEEQVDTNDVGGSSSSGGGEGVSSSQDEPTSFGTELEALGGLYGVLDTIRDTLAKRLTPATEEIRDCLYNFKLCTALEPLQIDWTGMPQDTSLFQVDTAILKYIKPMMDSSVKLDSAQLKVLKQLDSLYKRGLVNDTDMIQAVNAIKGDINDVESAVKGVRHGIDSLIDSMTTYMDKVGQGLAAVGDSVGALRGVVEGLFDTTGFGSAFAGASGSVDTAWGAYSDTMSGRYGKLITKASGGAWGDSASLETVFAPNRADSVCNNDSCLDREADSSLSYQRDSAEAMLQRAKDSLVADTGLLAAYYDTLSREMRIFNFDSVILAPLREVVPSQNNCPEDCFTFSIDGGGNGYQSFWMSQVGTVSWPLCERVSGLDVDIFMILRVLGRLLTALTCVYIGLWFIANRKI